MSEIYCLGIISIKKKKKKQLLKSEGTEKEIASLKSRSQSVAELGIKPVFSNS